MLFELDDDEHSVIMRALSAQVRIETDVDEKMLILSALDSLELQWRNQSHDEFYEEEE